MRTVHGQKTVADALIVVPCYNESERLDQRAFQEFSCGFDVRFLLVNDGSRDDTANVIDELAARSHGRIQSHHLEQNRGKAEAVRQGMLRGFETGARYVGFWDADLATPLWEIPSFIETLDLRPEMEVAMGSRIKLLGRAIERKPIRQVLGRCFATVASRLLRIGVYDTQCGAKLFRNTENCAAIFAERFHSRWIFDVEFLMRLAKELGDHDQRGLETAIVEMPLRQWRDVAGSKVKGRDFVKALNELWTLYWRYPRPRRFPNYEPTLPLAVGDEATPSASVERQSSSKRAA